MANMDIGLNIYWFWNLTGTEYKLTAYLENQLSNLYFNLMTSKAGAMVERVLHLYSSYYFIPIFKFDERNDYILGKEKDEVAYQS